MVLGYLRVHVCRSLPVQLKLNPFELHLRALLAHYCMLLLEALLGLFTGMAA